MRLPIAGPHCCGLANLMAWEDHIIVVLTITGPHACGLPNRRTALL